MCSGSSLSERFSFSQRTGLRSWPFTRCAATDGIRDVPGAAAHHPGQARHRRCQRGRRGAWAGAGAGAGAAGTHALAGKVDSWEAAAWPRISPALAPPLSSAAMPTRAPVPAPPGPPSILQGGFAPPILGAEQGAELLVEAIKAAGYEGKIKLVIDAASSGGSRRALLVPGALQRVEGRQGFGAGGPWPSGPSQK